MSTSQRAEDQLDFDSVNLADSRHFSLLYDRYAPALWKHALLRARSADEADEILAKTFLKTWEYVRARRKIRNVRAFLWTVAGRLLVDFYRANARTRARFADFSETEENPPVVMPVMDERLDLRSDAAEIVTALRQLGGDDQLLLTLRFVEELPLTEVASVYGRSKNATAVAIHRALKRLRKFIEIKPELKREA